MPSTTIRSVIALALGLVCCSPAALAQGQGSQLPGSGTLELAQLELNLLPIEGWTTASHPAPASLTVPPGTLLMFEHHTPPGYGSSWVGAVPVLNEPGISQAICRMDGEGLTTIIASAVPFVLAGQSGEVVERTCTIHVVDAPLGRATAIELTGETFTVIDGEVPNAVGLHFTTSIASLSELAPGRWATSVDRSVTAVAASNSPYASLLEWRVNGRAEAIGAEAMLAFAAPGPRSIEAGPPGGAVFAHLDVYETTIVAQTPDIDLIPGVEFQFLAVTNPPGFEDLITWMSSTAHGSAHPVLGRGPIFEVVFRDTYGPEGTQWVGVKADNAALGGDFPGGPGNCCIVSTGECITNVPANICDQAGGVWNPIEPCEAFCVLGLP